MINPNKQKGRIAVYPGSFDPITNGHLDILNRAEPLFDKIILLLAINSAKKGLFSFEERLDMLQEVLRGREKVVIDCLHDGLVVNYCLDKKAVAIVRGLRAVADFEYEYAVTLMNRRLASNLETIFLLTSDQYSFISSTIVKEVSRLGGSVADLVPDIVDRRLNEKFHQSKR